jgi:hypothetical protein
VCVFLFNMADFGRQNRKETTMNATTKLGLLGAALLVMVALPVYGRGPAGRDDGRRGRDRVVDRGGRDHRSGERDWHRGRDERRGSRHHDRDDDNLQVRIRIGSGTVVHSPQPVRYRLVTQTVLVEPAHYETRIERVLVRQGYWQERVIPGRREYVRDSRGNLHEVQVTPDRVERVWIEPVYETRTVRVLVPARYETRTVRQPVGGSCGSVSTTYQSIGSGLQILGRVLIR